VLAGRYVQISMVLTAVGYIPGVVLWCTAMESAILWFGFDEETARLGQSFAYVSLSNEIILGVCEVLEEYLAVAGYEKFLAILGFVEELCYTGLLVAFPLLGVKDLVIIAIAQTFVSVCFIIGLVTYVLYKGWLDDIWEGMAKSNGFKDRRAVRNMASTAIPMSVSWLLTYGEVRFVVSL